jgi:predicted RNase H-like HicB family nuclease
LIQDAREVLPDSKRARIEVQAMKKRKIRIAHLLLTIERNGDGFLARCPTVEGAFAEGDTVGEAIFNCLDVVRMILDYKKERGETLLQSVSESLTAKKEIAFTIPVEV